jgi:hypothetical protein
MAPVMNDKAQVREQMQEFGRIKTRIIKKLLEKLNANPERVLFPKKIFAIS